VLPEDETSFGQIAEARVTLTLPQLPPIFAVAVKLAKMTKGTFGDNLKREREMRGVSLDEISTATRNRHAFSTSIENEQWDQLPGGVFNRDSCVPSRITSGSTKKTSSRNMRSP